MNVLAALLVALSLQGPVTVERSVGMEGQWLLRWSGTELFARAVEDGAPIVLRIADSVLDTETAGGSTIYDLRFIASRPGEYDLGAWLVDTAGEPVDGLPAMPARVVSVLPDEHDGRIEEPELPGLPIVGGYRFWAIVLGVLWIVPIVALIARRWRRRPRKVVPVVSSGPTLADQLKPLVEAALRGRLSTAEQGHLERLLIAHWRERLGLDGATHLAAVRAMRDHAEAGQLLGALEDWLHRPPGAVDVDVDEVLTPYRNVAALAEPPVAAAPPSVGSGAR